MASQAEKNLFHPLVSLEWQSCVSPPTFDRLQDAQAVVLNNKVYVSAADITDGMMGFASNIVFIYDVRGNSWKKTKSATYQHALAVYNKKLVLVGGIHHTPPALTNELWVLQEDWSQPLPPMPTKRCNASAVGTGSHLAVAGGNEPGPNFHPSRVFDMVEIYDGQEWKVTKSLPKPSYRMKSVLQGDTWYLMGGEEQGREVYYTSLENLIATTSSNPATSVWKKIPDVPFEKSTPAVSMNELIAIGGKKSVVFLLPELQSVLPPQFTSTIHAYSTSTRSWVYVGDMPTAYCSTCAITLPSGELFMLGTASHRISIGGVRCEDMLKGYTREIQFPDGKFSMSAIARMKATAGIDICHELAPKCGRMMKKLSLPQSLSYDQSPTGTIRVAFEEWLAGKSSLRPTWEEMMEVFREIKMIHLAGRIEKYFGTTSENAIDIAKKAAI